MGIPLDAGGAPLSFLPAAVLPPLGIRLPILEDFFPASAGTGSLSSLGGVLALLALLLAFSSFSLGWARDLLLELFPEPLAVETEAEGGDDTGVWCMGAPSMPAVPPPSRLMGMGVGSSPYSDRSSSSCSDISATEGEVREAERGLMSRNLSSMERWLPGALAAAQTEAEPLAAAAEEEEEATSPVMAGGRRRSEAPGGGGEVVGLRESMEEVALCLRFMDLLRHDLPAVGEGMAEPSWCPLGLEGIAAAPALPFMLPTRAMPLTDSAAERERECVFGVCDPVSSSQRA